jgi:hypothetical protein
MKYVKMLGLAAVAAMALAAFAGAGTASATTVCTSGTTTSPCLSGQKPYSGKIVAKLKAGTEAVLSGSLSVKCKESVVSGTTNSSGVGTIESATFKSCTTCPTVTSLTPWGAKAITGTAPNGTMVVEKPVVHLEGCFGFAKCTASATSVTLDVIGGTPAMVIAKAEPLTISGFGCGTSGTWTAEYEVTTPTSLFLEP